MKQKHENSVLLAETPEDVASIEMRDSKIDRWALFGIKTLGINADALTPEVLIN